MQPIIQNGGGDLRIAAEIITSENATEVKNIINRIQVQKEAKEEEMQQAQQEQQQQQMQMQAQMEQERLRVQKQIADDKNLTTLQAAELNAERFARANDVNENNENDLVELQMLKNQSTADVSLKEEKMKQIELQNKKLEKEIALMGKDNKNIK
jgi:hypothetical protein